MKKQFKTLLSAVIFAVAIISCNKVELKQESPDNSVNTKAYDFREDKKLILACKSNVENTTTLAREYDGVDMNVINAIYAITPGSDRLAAFSLLSANERYAYWDNLISIKVENQGLIQDQKDLLTDFRELVISPTIYGQDQDGDNARAVLDSSLDDIVNQFEQNGITTAQLANIFASSSFGDSNNIPFVVNGGNQPSCSCNKGSVVNSWKMRKCGDACGPLGSGCGFAGMYSCDGRPYQIGPHNSHDYLDNP